MSKTENSNLNLIIIFKKNKIHIWIFLAVFILVSGGSIFYIKTHPDQTMYVSQSEFKVINGEKTLNLYLGTYNRITTIDDVATVLRSNEVLNKVIAENKFDVNLALLRQNIDIYETSEMQFILRLIWPDEKQGEKINASIVENYLIEIENRMDNDNKALFDVKMVQVPHSGVLGQRTNFKILAAFVFGIFCGIIINLIIQLLEKIVLKARSKK
jgi:capsular polysaccharide biosynthesis protein